MCVIDTGVDISHPTFGRGCPEGPNCRIAFGFDVESQGDDPVSSLEGRAHNLSWQKVQVRNTFCQQQSQAGGSWCWLHAAPHQPCQQLLQHEYHLHSALGKLLAAIQASCQCALAAARMPSRISRHAEQCRSSCAAGQPDSDHTSTVQQHHTVLPSPSAVLQVLTIMPCICLFAGHADPFRLGKCRGSWDPRVRHSTRGLPSQAEGCRWQSIALSEGGGIRC